MEHVKSPIISSQDYYPFGLTFNGYLREDGLSNPFQYNGKEMQDEGGLGWLDYGARMYMPEIGRWGVVDPMAEGDRRWSVYRYGYDNPMRFIDPDGRFEYSNGYSSANSRTETGAVEHWQLSEEQMQQGKQEKLQDVLTARISSFELKTRDQQQRDQQEVRTTERNHWFGETIDIHIETLYRDYKDMTIVTHNVLMIEHDKDGEPTNRKEYAIGIIITNDGNETWGYGEARFSRNFYWNTAEIYRARAQLQGSSVFEKYIKFITEPLEKKKNRATVGPIHR